MIAFLVVFQHPGPADLPDLVQVPEQPGIQHFLPVAAVEALNIRILVRLAWLDVIQQDAVVSAPVRKRFTQELRAVIPVEYMGFADRRSAILYTL